MKLLRAKQRILSILIVPLALCLLSACQREIVPQGSIAQVERITNQQELELVGLVGQPDITDRVRLAGIAMPSTAQHPWGNAAKTRLEQLLTHQSVLLSNSSRRSDRGTRSVYAWLNGVLLNEKLVAEGFAVTVPQPLQPSYERRFDRAQDRARILGLGIWNPQNPLRQPPAASGD